MGMSVTEFLRRKNEIIKAVTGVILVPEDQIVDIPENKRPLPTQNKKYSSPEYRFLESDFCPYCTLYLDNKCNGCPMNEAGNRCSPDNDNTWSVVNNLWIVKSIEEDWKKLRDLIVEYNKQFEITVKEFYEQRRSK